MTKDAAQRSPSALLRAVSMSNGRWTFYEAVNHWFGVKKEKDNSVQYRPSYLGIDDEVFRIRFKAGNSEGPD